MDINVLAKIYTRKELIEYVLKREECPDSYYLATFGLDECEPYHKCKECWKQAIKDIKFKGENKVLKANEEMEKEFLKGRTLVINTRTENQYNKLIKWSKDKGIPWATGSAKALSGNRPWNDYKENTCVRYCGGTILHYDIGFYKEHGYKIVTYRQFFKPQKTEKQSFEVGDTVKIKEDLKILEEYDGFYIFSDMASYRGKETVIKRMSYEGSFKLDCDEEEWNWSPSMLTLVKKKSDQKKEEPKTEPLTLKDFYDMQAKLDKVITDNYDSTMEQKDFLVDRFVALFTEVGELANATRCFKYWSEKEAEPKERILDEYADVMHFFLSIGNALGFTPEEIEEAYLKKNKINYQRQKEGY